MRPRHKAAENRGTSATAATGPIASMRPRHKAAENTRAGGPTPAIQASFNEAAA